MLTLHPGIQPIEHEWADGDGDFGFVHGVTFYHTGREFDIGLILLTSTSFICLLTKRHGHSYHRYQAIMRWPARLRSEAVSATLALFTKAVK